MKFKEIKGEKLPKGPILESWLVVHIKKQKFVFFSQVWQLVDTSLDKKFDLNNKHVIVKECIALFGGSKKFNIKAHDLKLEDRITMEEIYYKLFGTSIITNNDMPTWIVHGYITHTKGQKKKLAGI